MVRVGFVGLMMVAMTACAQPPTERLEIAQKTVDAAKAAGAAEYAKEDFATLEQQLALAKDEVAQQENAFSIFRSYTEADKLLIKVVGTGGPIAVKATQRKEAAKSAALAMEIEAQLAVATAKELLAKAPRGKEKVMVEVLKQDVAGLETSLSEVRELIEKADYLGAEARAKAVREAGAAISVEIQSAIDKVKGLKRSSHSSGA